MLLFITIASLYAINEEIEQRINREVVVVIEKRISRDKEEKLNNCRESI
jgi:hypothetical protein